MSGQGIQQLTGEQRKTITIDDKETVVYDYSCFEPSIAYSLVGETKPEDIYEISLDGYCKSTLRDIAKKCLLIMLNITDRSSDSIRHACNSAIRNDFDLDDLSSRGLIPERVDVLTICDLLDSKNYKIRQFFYGNSDTDTTHIGSLICDYVTDYFSQRGIVVLSVFDEFIIQEEYEEDLIKVMKNAYSFICDSDSNCKITKEK